MLHPALNIRLWSVLLALSLFQGCVRPAGDTIIEKRNVAQHMRSQTLNTFYSIMPEMRAVLQSAPGFGVFSGTSTQTVFVSSGQGYGIIRDNATNQDVYMSAVKLGGGLGVGISDVRAVVVFTDPGTLRNVVNHGWGVTGKVDAAAKVGDSGGAGAVVITLPGMTIYRFTRNGVMLGGAIEGTKIWQDEELN
jgi:lipid-binding SYLF domain-containing protein